MKLSSNYTANWTFGSEKIRAEYLKESNDLHDALIACGAIYAIDEEDYFREGYRSFDNASISAPSGGVVITHLFFIIYFLLFNLQRSGISSGFQKNTDYIF